MADDTKTLWDERYERSRNMLRSMFEADVPKIMIQNEARLLLQAYHSGPWRAIWALIKHQIVRAWYHYAGMKWEWVRTRALRRIPDPVLEVAERVAEEDKELEGMVNSL